MQGGSGGSLRKSSVLIRDPPRPSGVTSRSWPIWAHPPDALLDVLHPAVRITERPAAINPRGAVRDRDAAIAGFLAGKDLAAARRGRRGARAPSVLSHWWSASSLTLIGPPMAITASMPISDRGSGSPSSSSTPGDPHAALEQDVLEGAGRLAGDVLPDEDVHAGLGSAG
jgi:hypothetical protein